MMLESTLLGSFVTSIISRKVTDYGDSLYKNIQDRLKSGTLPANNDMELAIRSACLRASRAVLDTIKSLKSPETLPFLDRRPDIKAFVQAADDLLKRNQKLLKDQEWSKKLPQTYSESFDKKIVDAALARFEGPMACETDVEKLTAIVLMEIIDGVDVECPVDIHEIFYGEKQGWPEAFRYCLGEELKNKDRFRTIYSAFKISDIETRLIKNHEEIISQLQSNIDQGLFDSINKTLDDIKDNTDEILLNQKKTNDFLEQNSQELAGLRREYNLSNREIGKLLNEMGVLDDAPESVHEAIKFANSKFCEIKQKLSMPSNAVSPYKSLLDDAKALFNQGEILRSEAIIRTYNQKQAIWQKEQLETLEQASREHSEGLVIEAEFAMLRRDIVAASELYKQAVTASSILGDEENQKILFKAHMNFYNYGTISPSATSFNTALYFIVESLKYVHQDEKPEYWALLQNNLGIVYASLGIRVSGDNIMENLGLAELAFRGALTVRTIENLPQDWALTQTNLGNVLREIGVRISGPEATMKLLASEEALRETLKIRTKIEVPKEWANIQMGLGIVLREIGIRISEPESSIKLEEAERALRAALTIRKKEESPQKWAEAQLGLGNVLSTQGEKLSGLEAVKKFESAEGAYRAVLKIYGKQNSPLIWAKCQSNLGNVLSELGSKLPADTAKEKLKDAELAYRNALKVNTKKDLPQEWAITQNCLGMTLKDLGIILEGPASILKLKAAKEALREALTVRTKTHLPQLWAKTNNNLGWVLKEIGIRSSGIMAIENLEFAESAYRDALTMITKEELPDLWASTHNDLATVLHELGSRLSGTESTIKLGEAEKSYEKALTIYTKVNYPKYWSLVHSNLKELQKLLRR